MALYVDIEKRLGAFRLRVKFEAGNEVLALFGASGCGKSMTLKCIAGIETPDRGRIILDGRTLFDSEKRINLSPQKRRVGYLFQQYALFPNMTVRQNIAVGVRDKARRDEIVPSLIAAMSLEGTEEKRPAQLSGGQQQRVALARILANEPEVLMLDEPFSALDAHLRFRLEQQMSTVLRSFGKSVLLVSHDREEVYRLSDRIAIMHSGSIEKTGPKEEVFLAPGTRSGALLIGCKNVTKIEKLSERRVFAPAWNMELDLNEDIGDRTYIGIHSHDLRGTGDKNVFTCDVAEEVENPFSTVVIVRKSGGGESLAWKINKEAWDSIRAETVSVCLPPESILLLKE